MLIEPEEAPLRLPEIVTDAALAVGNLNVPSIVQLPPIVRPVVVADISNVPALWIVSVLERLRLPFVPRVSEPLESILIAPILILRVVIIGLLEAGPITAESPIADGYPLGDQLVLTFHAVLVAPVQVYVTAFEFKEKTKHKKIVRKMNLDTLCFIGLVNSNCY
jgi:hypothetical protein